MAWNFVCELSDLESKGHLALEIDQQEILLFWRSGKVFCYPDRCTHQDIRLSDFGYIEGDSITCFAHGARFSILDGRVEAPPACEGLKSLPCRIQGTGVEVQLPLDGDLDALES